MAESRIRLALLGGYLGAGKTTWLRHLLHEMQDIRPYVIVNEAALVAVDDQMLAGASGVSVIHGCACCTGLPALMDLLRGLCDQRSTGAAGLDHIWLETSGLADPAPILQAIRDDPVLVHHVLVAEVIVLVDALHGLAQLRADPLSRRQIEAADRIILTKTNVPAGSRLLPTLRALNPAAGLSAADHGVACPLPESGGRPEILPEAEPNPPIKALSLHLEGPDWASLSLWLSALIDARGDQIVRIKGVIRTPAGRLLLQSVRRIVQSPEVLPPAVADTDDTVVFLGHGITLPQLHRSLSAWTGISHAAAVR